MTIPDLTPSTFRSVVEGDGIVVVDCWAGWCGPCRSFEPVFEQAALRHSHHQFAKLDTVAHQELSQKFGVEKLPTLLVYRDGILLTQHPGSMSPEGLADLVEQAEALDMDFVRAEIARASSMDHHAQVEQPVPGADR